jgi:hypothetical protein
MKWQEAFWLQPCSFFNSLQHWLERLAMGVERGLKILLAWMLVDAAMAE